MAENLEHLVDLGGLQQLAVMTNERISTADTYNIKYVNAENNVLKFYRNYDSVTGVTGVQPAFMIDFPSELFLDNLRTTFEPDFEFSPETYSGATDPDLDGKPVLVLAIKTTSTETVQHDAIYYTTHGYTFWGGHSFKVEEYEANWSDAKAAAEVLGGHLPTSTSAEKNAFLCTLVENDYVWLAGTDIEEKGVWRWTTGETWSYTNWDEGCPSNVAGQEGVTDHDYIKLITETGKWEDAAETRFSKTQKQIYEWDYDLRVNPVTSRTESINYHFISLESLVDIYTIAAGDSSKILSIAGYTVTVHISSAANNAITVQNDGLHVDISGKTDKVTRNPIPFNPYDENEEAQNYADFNTAYSMESNIVLLMAGGNLKDSGIRVATSQEVSTLLNSIFNPA